MILDLSSLCLIRCCLPSGSCPCRCLRFVARPPCSVPFPTPLSGASPPAVPRALALAASLFSPMFFLRTMAVPRPPPVSCPGGDFHAFAPAGPRIPCSPLAPLSCVPHVNVVSGACSPLPSFFPASDVASLSPLSPHHLSLSASPAPPSPTSLVALRQLAPFPSAPAPGTGHQYRRSGGCHKPPSVLTPSLTVSPYELPANITAFACASRWARGGAGRVTGAAAAPLNQLLDPTTC